MVFSLSCALPSLAEPLEPVPNAVGAVRSACIAPLVKCDAYALHMHCGVQRAPVGWSAGQARATAPARREPRGMFAHSSSRHALMLLPASNFLYPLQPAHCFCWLELLPLVLPSAVDVTVRRE